MENLRRDSEDPVFPHRKDGSSGTACTDRGTAPFGAPLNGGAPPVTCVLVGRRGKSGLSGS